MNDEAIYQLLLDLEFPSDQIEQWKDLVQSLEKDEKKKLAETLTQQKRERETLSARQSIEVGALIDKWQGEE